MVTTHGWRIDDGYGVLPSLLVSGHHKRQRVQIRYRYITFHPLARRGFPLSWRTCYKFGYYVPFMIANGVIMSIGAGLITTFTSKTIHARWIGYQVIFGYGLGLGM